MQIDKNFIETAPKQQDIFEIINWLKDEMDNKGTSFYHNRDIIVESYENNNSIVFKHGNENIGIAIWHEDNGMRVDIDIFVIHPDYRGQGYGEFYYKTILSYFRSEGFKTIKLFCEPQASKTFWEKMGLVKYPKCGRTEHELTYYEVLVTTASEVYISKADKIELWNVDPYEAEETEPKWTWYIERQAEKLLYPIIQPCNYDWNLRWSKNDVVIKEDKVKYFTDKTYELCCSQFLYIDKLKK